MQKIISSVWYARHEILSTIALFFIGVYFFALVAFKFFWADFDHYCDTILHCFLTISDYAFKSNGGIGGWLITMRALDECKSRFNLI